MADERRMSLLTINLAQPNPPPPGFDTLLHFGQGEMLWQNNSAKLHLDRAQADDGSMAGDGEFFERMKAANPLNVNVLDALMEFGGLLDGFLFQHWSDERYGKIPHLAFWGTIYIDPKKDLYVPCIISTGKSYRKKLFLMGGVWDRTYPAMVRA
jgi:hypothetical protein